MSSIATSGGQRGGALSARLTGPRLWQNLWVRLAVALAFADASIVVLALPQIVDRLGTPITHVTWVIIAYNLALIVTSLALAGFAFRLPSAPTLVAGLAIFGVASIGCGASSSLSVLIPFRCVQGIGGALVLAASLPLFAESARPGESPLVGWSAAAAIGAAVGPAVGGVLTQLFDWRSIFFAQAPVAALAAVAVIAARGGLARSAGPATDGDLDPAPAAAPGGDISERPAAAPADAEAARELDPLTANLALALLSAGIIGALFLVVIELINAWLLTPIAAAAIVTTIPVATALAERLVRGRAAVVLGATGAGLVVAGLVVLALLHTRQLGWVVFALALGGAGLGLAYPGLTAAALRSGGSPLVRAAKTVAARDAGLMLGLLVLTPVFSHQITKVTSDKGPVAQATAVLVKADLPLVTKTQLGIDLLQAYSNTGQADVPNIAPAFAKVRADASPSVQNQLDQLQSRLNGIIQRAVTPAFRRPYVYAGIFALLVLPLLVARLSYLRRRPFSARPPSAAAT